MTTPNTIGAVQKALTGGMFAPRYPIYIYNYNHGVLRVNSYNSFTGVDYDGTIKTINEAYKEAEEGDMLISEPQFNEFVRNARRNVLNVNSKL